MYMYNFVQDFFWRTGFMFNKQLINGDTWVFMGRIYRIWYVTPMKVMKILRNFYAVVALLKF